MKWAIRSQVLNNLRYMQDNTVMGYIYCITSPSGKRYIGQTERGYEKRYREHCKLPGSCILLENAIAKYGKEQMNFEVLLMIDNNRLDEYEIKFIRLYDTMEPSGYNIRTGGEKGTHSEASKERMRLAKMGEKNHNYGKERSESAKKAISLSKSGTNHHFYGKTFTEEHKLSLSKSHKKSHADLPMYLVYLKERPAQYQASGYAVVNHPTLKSKYFTSKKLSDEEKLHLAEEYLKIA
jgi:group I intron endonuclease